MKEQNFTFTAQLPCEPLSDHQLQEFVSESIRNHIDCTIDKIERVVVKRRSDWRGTRLFERLTVHLENHKLLELFLKYYHPLETVPFLTTAAEREAIIYSSFLRKAQLGTAKFYGKWNSAQNGQTALLLEFVKGRKLKRMEPAGWFSVAKWLGGFHYRFSSSGEQSKIDGVVQLDAGFYQNWANLAGESIARISPKAYNILADVVRNYDLVAGPLGEGPRTLVHGEFYCTNILIHKQTDRLRICPFDWETAGIGCAAIDLAFLLRQELGIDEDNLLQEYTASWKQSGGSQISLSDLKANIRRCRIHELIYTIWTKVAHKVVIEAKAIKYAERAKRQFEGLMST